MSEADTLVAALKARYKSPAHAMRTLGLDAALLTGRDVERPLLPMSSGHGFLARFSTILAQDASAGDAMKLLDTMRGLAGGGAPEEADQVAYDNPSDESDDDDTSGGDESSAAKLHAILAEHLPPEAMAEVGKILAEMAGAPNEGNEAEDGGEDEDSLPSRQQHNATRNNPVFDRPGAMRVAQDSLDAMFPDNKRLIPSFGNYGIPSRQPAVVATDARTARRLSSMFPNYNRLK